MALPPRRLKREAGMPRAASFLSQDRKDLRNPLCVVAAPSSGLHTAPSYWGCQIATVICDPGQWMGHWSILFWEPDHCFPGILQTFGTGDRSTIVTSFLSWHHLSARVGCSAFLQSSQHFMQRARTCSFITVLSVRSFCTSWHKLTEAQDQHWVLWKRAVLIPVHWMPFLSG